MAELTITREIYKDKVLGGWLGKCAGITLGYGVRGRLQPANLRYYNPVPGQAASSPGFDFSLVSLSVFEEYGADIKPEHIAAAWEKHLSYYDEEYGYSRFNRARGLTSPACGAWSNWFHNSSAAVMRADFWSLIIPGSPQKAASFAYHDACLDHSEEGVWAAMFLAAMGSAAFFITDILSLLTIGLVMMPRTCRTARAVKAAISGAHEGRSWLETREMTLKEAGNSNFSDAAQNMGFVAIGLLYGRAFGEILCAGVNCGYDTVAVGSALGVVLGIRYGEEALPKEWTRPLGQVVIPGAGLKDFSTPADYTELAERTVIQGQRAASVLNPHLEITANNQTGQVPATSQAITASIPTASAEEAPDFPPIPNLQQEEELTEKSAAAQITAESPTTNLLITETGSAELEAHIGSVIPVSREAQENSLPSPDAAGNEQEISSSESSQEDEKAQIPSSVPPLEENVQIDNSSLTQHIDPSRAIAWADNSDVKRLLVTPSYSFSSTLGEMQIMVDAGESLAAAYGERKTVRVTVRNPGSVSFIGRIKITPPLGWQVMEPSSYGTRQVVAAGGGIFTADYGLMAAEKNAKIQGVNTLSVLLIPEQGDKILESNFSLIGSSCWWTTGPFPNYEEEGFDRAYPPEQNPDIFQLYISRTLQSIRWERRTFPELTLDLEPLFAGSSGVCYGQTILSSPAQRGARITANTNHGVKMWINGSLVLSRNDRQPFWPQPGSGPWAADVILSQGENQVLIKWVRGSDPYAFSLTVSDRDGRLLPDVCNTSW